MRVPGKWILIAAAVALIAGGTSVSYTADCIRCLHQVRGSEKLVFGLRLWHSRSPAHDSQASVGAIGLPSLPVGRSSTFVEILGAACDHEFKRDGFGRSPLLGGGVSCGGYADARAFEGRRYALSSLDHLYSRVPDLALAKQSYAVIERIFPFATSLDRAMAPDGPRDEVLAFAAALNFVDSADAWIATLKKFDNASAAPAAVRPEVDSSLERLRSADSVLRQAAGCLAAATPALNRSAPLAGDAFEQRSPRRRIRRDQHSGRSSSRAFRGDAPREETHLLRAYLLAELAGTGLIADPGFFDAIERFRNSVPASSPTNTYSAAHIFQIPRYARFIEFARHRCRGIHLWRLGEDSEGRHTLSKSRRLSGLFFAQTKDPPFRSIT
jgi:hypothetical protein